jgi:hypothetical protein
MRDLDELVRDYQGVAPNAPKEPPSTRVDDAPGSRPLATGVWLLLDFLAFLLLHGPLGGDGA